MKGTKWTDKGDGKEYTYESQGNYMSWDAVKKKFKNVSVVVLSTVLLEDLVMVIPMILFHKNFITSGLHQKPEGNTPTTH